MNSKAFLPNPIGIFKVIFSPEKRVLSLSELSNDKYTLKVLEFEFLIAPIALIVVDHF